MQEKTLGIVLHSIKYSDSATILTIYTQNFGRVSYMIHGANRKKTILRSALFQALSIIELDVVHQVNKDLQRIKDVRVAYHFQKLPYDAVKNSLALFIAEVLYKTLRQTEPDENLFAFLENSIQQLDHIDKGIGNFHLVFLIKLSRYLGFEPYDDEEGSDYFDLMNGVFLRNKPLHAHYLSREATEDFSALLNVDYTNMYELAYSRQRRAKLLVSIVEYYRLHIPEFNGLHSLAVLQSLFD